jgi:putative transposase
MWVESHAHQAKERASVDVMTSEVIDIFQVSRQNYGTRKIKVELKKRGHIVPRRRNGRIMQEQGLVSTYDSSI